MKGRFSFLLSLPERALRSVAALAGGTLHETAELLLPRLVRRSRLYEATAKNLLRVSIELVGGVTPPAGAAADELEPDAKKLAERKTAGNAVELGSIAAFGFSPLWLLAGAADVTRGTRVYLDTLVHELTQAGVLADDAHLGSVDDLLGALEGTSGRTARLIDIPPLELEMARHVGRLHVLDPYKKDLRPVRDEGFGAYATRVSRPYAAAVARHFDLERKTLTERGIGRARGKR